METNSIIAALGVAKAADLGGADSILFLYVTAVEQFLQRRTVPGDQTAFQRSLFIGGDDLGNQPQIVLFLVGLLRIGQRCAAFDVAQRRPLRGGVN